MLSTLSRFQRALTPETVARHQPRGGGTTCISWKFSHQVTPLAIVGNLATRTRNLNYLKIWPPGGTICISWKFWPPSGSTCISWKFGDQVVSLVLVINLATRWHHLYCF